MAGERPPSSARRGARAPGAPPALLCLLLLLLLLCVAPRGALGAGTVVNTWPFTDATAAAYAELVAGGSHVDAVVAGCSRCEELQCDGSVGFGGSPDERGETTLDAMVMDAETMNVGSVGALRGVKGASRAARLVLDYTTQTLIVGEQAAAFAVGLGMEAESLETAGSMEVFEDWRRADCQPNFWADPTSSLSPDPKTSCGPYALASAGAPRGAAGGNLRDADLRDARARPAVAEGNHDTIGMVVIDAQGRIAAGTSTNGSSHKVPGRVGDSPIAGAGSYATVHGGCASTGDGDVMMRFLPCYQAVESLRLGMSACEAAWDAMDRITAYYPSMSGAMIVVGPGGEHAGAASAPWRKLFKYSVASDDTEGEVQLFGVCDRPAQRAAV